MKFKKISRISDNPTNPSSPGKGLHLRYISEEGILTGVDISSEKLRRACPCASCQQKRGDTSHDRPLTGTKKSGSSLLKVISATSEEECNLEKIWLLGNYALGMKWGDGHDTGIYTFDLLKELVILNE